MLEIKTINNELTMIGYFKKGLWLEISKHYETTMGGKARYFWRVDSACGTISTLNRTKAEALKEAREYIRRQDWKNK